MRQCLPLLPLYTSALLIVPRDIIYSLFVLAYGNPHSTKACRKKKKKGNLQPLAAACCARENLGLL
jgi:hypothetical protein